MQVDSDKLQGRLRCVILLAISILKLEIGIKTCVSNDDSDVEISNDNGDQSATVATQEKDFVVMDFWDEHQWKDFVAELCKLRHLLNANDVTTFAVAPLLHYGITNNTHNTNSNTINENVASRGDSNDKTITTNKNHDDKSFQQRISTLEKLDTAYKNVLDLSLFHWAMSYIRLDVEDVMNATKGTKLDIDDDEIEEM